jgi:hypothetical protein
VTTTSNNKYKLYTDSVLNLAGTMVIKFSDVAASMNLQVITNHGIAAVNDADPYSWKYYQNISGSYHLTDEMITISSLDTATVINFTVANLLIHKATRIAYEYGTRHYKELVSRYPNQELLILGILYPCSISKAVTSLDGTILSYPSNLVDENEYSFIPKLQNWIYKYMGRWINTPFGISDDLYVATYIAQLYLHLVQAILVFRLEACKTNEAHSFHVQQYLASHGYLDVYLDSLKKSQALFFYRNICYIERNAGKKDTFDWLVDNIMTTRGLSFYEYVANHDVSEITRDVVTVTPNLPEITFKRKPLNLPGVENPKINYDYPTTLENVKPLAVGNAEFQKYEGVNMETTLKYSPSSVVNTKLLESSLGDQIDIASIPLADILFNHWIYFASTSQLLASIFVTLPNNGGDIRLEPQEAVALWSYAFYKAYEPEIKPVGYPLLTNISQFHLSQVIRQPAPTRAEFLSITEKKFVASSDIDLLLTSAVTANTFPATTDFIIKGREIYQQQLNQYTLFSRQDNLHARAELQACALRFYKDPVVYLDTLSDPITHVGHEYATWLSSKSLNLSAYTKLDFYNLSNNILELSIGKIENTALMFGNIQRSMVSLFTNLSSYSIQVLNDNTANSVLQVSQAQIRVGDDRTIEKEQVYSHSATVTVESEFVKELVRDTLTLDAPFSAEKIKYRESQHELIDVPIDIFSVNKVISDYSNMLTSVDVLSTSEDFDVLVSTITPYQARYLKDGYSNAIDAVIPMEIRIVNPF